MNKTELFNAISGIDDDIAAEAAHPAARRKHGKIMKTAAVAAAAAALMGITALAANLVITGVSSHGSNRPDYTAVPSPETLAKDVGISPTLPESYAAGFEFAGAGKTENTAYDEDDNAIGTFKGISCDYERDGLELSIYIEPGIYNSIEPNRESVGSYKGAELMYMSYTNKLVPGSYELTEQDKADRDSGKYVFTFGSPELEIIEVQGLSWIQNGLHFDIVDINGAASKDELIEIAKETIDAQK